MADKTEQELEKKAEIVADGAALAADLEPQDGGEDEELSTETQNDGLRGEEELDLIFSQRGGVEVEADEVKPAPAPRARQDGDSRRGAPRDMRDFMLGELEKRAQRANQRLRGQLMGSVKVTLKGKAAYLFDWRGDKALVKELTSESDTKGAADCCVTLGESDLIRLVNGDLNPQLAMLSDRIRVEGQLGMAIYFFNLVVPAGREI